MTTNTNNGQQKFEKAKTYWQTKYSEEIKAINLPRDNETTRQYRKAVAKVEYPEPLATKIQSLSKQKDVLLYVVLHAGLKAFIYKYADQPDIAIGTPVYTKNPVQDDKETLIVFRDRLKETQTFKEVLTAVKQTVLEGYEHQYYVMEKMLDVLGITEPQDNRPNVIFLLENIHNREHIAKISETAANDITISITRNQNKLEGEIQYNAEHFKESTIENIWAHNIQVMTQLMADINIKLADVEIMTEQEREQVIETFNATETGTPINETIHRQFRRQVEKTPHAIAVENEEHQLTYAEMDRRAGQLATRLRKVGVTADSVVALLMEGGIETPIAMMGVQKAGAAYLPIDHENPPERIKTILRDSNPAALVIRETTDPKDLQIQQHQDPAKIIRMQDGAKPDETEPYHDTDAEPDNLAYVIYTSGTTGTPKGIQVEHRGMINYTQWRQKTYQYTAGDVALQVLPYVFDGYGSNHYTSILSGGRLIMIPDRKKLDADYIKEIIKKHRVTNTSMVPTMYQMILSAAENGELTGLRFVVLAGERTTPAQVRESRQKAPNATLVNEYGPSESTVTAAGKWGMTETATRNIGPPIDNVRVYILDGRQQPVPPQVDGEMWVSGAGIARGYINDPEQTHEKFKPNPWKEGERLYRTGDRARWQPGGTLELQGRIDHQVKIRGYRIEPGEIENKLTALEAVKEATVQEVRDSAGEKALCAYLVTETQQQEVTEIRERLSELLPDYMIPAYIMKVPRIPQTLNGKVDTKALPAPEIVTGQDYTAPRNPVEEKLVEIWSEVLSVPKEKIGIDAIFFNLGGHSLKATVMAGKIHRQLDVKIPLAEVFKAPTIRAIAQTIAETVTGKTQEKYTPIEPAPQKDSYALSPAQKRMYIINRLAENSTGYNLPLVVKLEGPLDREKLERSFQELIRRHESLRTAIVEENGEARQRVHEAVPFAIEIHNAPETAPASPAKYIRPFDLSKAPLLRVELIEQKENEHILIVDQHHIITDGVSHGIMVQELLALYGGQQLPPRKIQYKDYSEWQHSPARRETLKQQEEYWLKEYAGEIPRLEIPTDTGRPPVQVFEGASYSLSAGQNQTEALNRIARQQGVTMYQLLQAIFNVLLAKLSGQDDIIVGTPQAGRNHPDQEGLIGMFVNTTALRSRPKGEKTFSQYLKEVAEKTLKAAENQDYPFEELVEKIDVPRDISRNPLFDVIFTIQNNDEPGPGGTAGTPGTPAGELRITPYPQEHTTAKFDITLTAMETGKDIYFGFEYATRLYKEETIRRYAERYSRIISAVTANPNRKIEDIEIITEDERRRIQEEFNRTGAPYPADKQIHQLFEEQEKRTPDAAAVVQGDHHLTYAELNRRAAGQAYYLKQKGQRPGAIVAIKVEPSLELFIGIMGILKAGAAYLPIDPETPQERIDYMIKDSAAGILIEKSETQSTKSETNSDLNPTNLAYIIYTSGTTGQPKGTLVEHRSLVNLSTWHNRKYGVVAADRATKYAGLGFDASVWEIFPYQIAGASIYIVNDDIKLDMPQLNAYYERNGITISFLPTQVCEQFMEHDNRSLRVLLTGGDKLRTYKQRNYELYNNYGPTEDTVVAAAYRVREISHNIPIGTPIDNNKIHIEDPKTGRPQPIGIPGELRISGDGLARGYLNNPELTAEKFVKTQPPHTSPLYKTGDRARWLPDGNIEYLGRHDSQVKIRGNRIEIGEIESRILRHPQIDQAAVAVWEDESGNKSLCAYTASKTPPQEQELRDYLRKHLPAGMIPAYYMQQEQLPLTPSGKIDRKALPEPQIKAAAGYIPPQNRLEERLAGIWEEVLGIEKAIIGSNTDFFQVGGHSLNAATMAARVHKELNVKIPLVEIFKTPTLGELAQQVRAAGRDRNHEYEAIPPAEQKQYYVVTPAQKRLYTLQQLEPNSTGYNIPVLLEVEEILDVQKLEETFGKLIARHESLRTAIKKTEGSPEPVQQIHPDVPFRVERYEGASTPEEAVSRFIRPFDLSEPPLMRVGVVPAGENKTLLMVDMHHIISDGVSHNVLIREYMASMQDRQLPELTIQYKDYAEWRAHALAESIKGQEAYWLEQYRTLPAPLNLPVDYARPDTPEYKGSTVQFEIEPAETEALAQIAREAGATTFMMILAIYNIFLHKVSGQDDIAVGVPTTGRRHPDMETLIGMFVNTLPIRNNPEPGKTFLQFLSEVKQKSLEAFENQDYQFEELVEAVVKTRDISRNPLFDVAFNYQNYNSPGAQDSQQPAGLKTYQYDFDISKFDLELNLQDQGDRLQVTLMYSTSLFTAEKAHQFAQYMETVTSGIIQNPQAQIAEIEIHEPEETTAILDHFTEDLEEE